MKMKLTIMNETGHTELDVTKSEMIEQIAEHPTILVISTSDCVFIYTNGNYYMTSIVR